MKRREFLLDCSNILLLLSSSRIGVADTAIRPSSTSAPITLFMCGDVMTGRGIDQVLPRPSDPRLHESYVKNANRYVELAQSASGPFPKRVDFSYPWGGALDELRLHARYAESLDALHAWLLAEGTTSFSLTPKRPRTFAPG